MTKPTTIEEKEAFVLECLQIVKDMCDNHGLHEDFSTDLMTLEVLLWKNEEIKRLNAEIERLEKSDDIGFWS